MAMLKPSQSYSGGVIFKPYTGNIAQELQFLTGEKKHPQTPFKDWVAHGNPVNSSIFCVKGDEWSVFESFYGV